MLAFDEKGHLTPYEITELTLPEFEAFFVDGLDDRAHRRGLFEGYLKYLNELNKIVTPPYFQWVNGSFTTLNPFPKDFDLVTIMDYDLHAGKLHELIWLKADGMLSWNIDSNFAFTSLPDHPNFDKNLQTQQF